MEFDISLMRVIVSTHSFHGFRGSFHHRIHELQRQLFEWTEPFHKRRGRGCDGSHDRAGKGRNPGSVDFKRGILWKATGRKTRKNQRLQSSELPLGSLDGHYNFVDAYHVEPAPRSHLDSSRVAFKLLNFQPQGFITASQRLNIG